MDGKLQELVKIIETMYMNMYQQFSNLYEEFNGTAIKVTRVDGNLKIAERKI